MGFGLGSEHHERSEIGAEADPTSRRVKLRIWNVKKPRNLLGPIVRQLRDRAGLTQPMFVARLNLQGWDLSRGTYAKVEAQIRWIADFEVVHLAEALGVKPGDLFDAAKGISKSAKKESRRTDRQPA